MVNVFLTPSFLSSHPHLTSTVLSKYFPANCSDCPLGNLQMRHPPVDPPVSDSPDECFEVDVKGKWTDPQEKPVRSFGGTYI